MAEAHRHAKQRRQEEGEFMPVYKIVHLDTQEVAIEEGADGRDACWKANWSPDRCEWVEITGELIELEESGDIEVIKGGKSGKRET